MTPRREQTQRIINSLKYKIDAINRHYDAFYANAAFIPSLPAMPDVPEDAVWLVMDGNCKLTIILICFFEASFEFLLTKFFADSQAKPRALMYGK